MRTIFVWVSSTHDATVCHMDGVVAGVAAGPQTANPCGDAIWMGSRERLCQRASVVKIGMTRMQQRRRVTGKLRAVAYRMCLEQTMWPHGVATEDQHGQFYKGFR